MDGLRLCEKRAEPLFRDGLSCHGSGGLRFRPIFARVDYSLPVFGTTEGHR